MLCLLLEPSFNAKAWYLWCFASFVSVGPFLNVYFQSVGLSKAQVGLIGALRPWTSAPASFVWAALADRTHAHRAVLLGTFAGSVAVRMLLLLPRSFSGLLTVVLLAELLAAPVGVLADAAVMQICEKETDYGKYRLWGAVGWGIFSTIAGWIISHLGIRWAFYTQAILALPSLIHGARLFSHRKGAAGGRRPTAAAAGGSSAAAAISDDHDDPEQERLLQQQQQQQQQQPQVLKGPQDLGSAGRRHGSRGYDELDRDSRAHELEHDPEEADPLLSAVRSERPDRHPEVPAGTGPAVGSGRPAAAAVAAEECRKGQAAGEAFVEEGGGAAAARYWRRLWALVQRVDVLLFFVTALVMGYGFGTIDSFLFLYLEQMGASGTLMGLTLTITCMAEVPAFQLQDRLLERWGVTAVLDLVQVVYAIRMALYAALPLAGNVMWVLPIEVLHGITFACGWGAGTVNCKLLAPPGLAATLQGAFQGLYFGAGYGLGSLVGGWVGTKLGWQGMFACAAATMFCFWIVTVAARHVVHVLVKATVTANWAENNVELTRA